MDTEMEMNGHTEINDEDASIPEDQPKSSPSPSESDYAPNVEGNDEGELPLKRSKRRRSGRNRTLSSAITNDDNLNEEETDEESDYMDDDEDDDDDDDDEDYEESATPKKKRARLQKTVSDDVAPTIEEPTNKLVDKILGWKHAPEGIKLYVSFKGLSYVHCDWVTEEDVLAESSHAKAKLNRFRAKDLPELLDEEDAFPSTFCEVDRILAARENPHGEGMQYMVKWKSLPYSQSTWECPSDFNDDQKIEEFMRITQVPSQLADKPRPGPDEWSEWSESPEYPNDHQLRPWQVTGVSWILFNWYNRRGCILADEMGLGKTVQTVATLVHMKQNYSRGPYLMVVPLSTVSHWKREFEGWSDFNVIVYHGSRADRELIRLYEWHYWDETGREIYKNQYYKFNALIVTYETILSDVHYLSQIKWKACVVDEAHRLKNKESKLFQALKQFKLEFRLILTGTPIQNNLQELWTLLYFIEPKTFASQQKFMREFGELNDSEQVGKLHQLLQPYLLRRMKEDVAKKIPPKEETIVQVELTMVQKKYYRAVLERNRSFLYEGCNKAELPKLTNIVIQLRKVCNHPYLLEGVEARETRDKTAPEMLQSLVQNSGKLVFVDKLLPKLKAGGHRVLIFSQMKMVLDLLEWYIKLKGYTYERIDGSIRGNERQAAIDRFTKEGSDRFLFLLSTRAGGLGINLATADTVIIYDSDWNPQNDMQAQARAHRIGQKQMVTVYRLITSRTYEQEMFKRASMKLGLDKAVLGKMQQKSSKMEKTSNVLSSMDKKEINSLLKYGAYDLFNESADKASESFCEEDIDQILKKRATVIKTGGDTSTNEASSFSKAVFQSSAADADVDMFAPDFWEKLIPDHGSAKSLLKALKEGNVLNQESTQKVFFDRLHTKVHEIIEMRKNGVSSKESDTVLTILAQLQSHAKLSQADRNKAAQWIQNIRKPRRERKTVDRFGGASVDEYDQPKPLRAQSNAFGSDSFVRKELKVISTLFYIASSFRVDEYHPKYKELKKFNNGNPLNPHSYTRSLFLEIRDKAELGHRSLREVASMCFAVIQLCLEGTDDEEERQILTTARVHLTNCLPPDLEKAEALDKTRQAKLKRETDTNGSDEKTTPTQEPALHEPTQADASWFPALADDVVLKRIQKSCKRWCRLLRAGYEVRQLVDILADPWNDMCFPSKLKNVPDPAWTHEDDKYLVVGVGIHGLDFDSIRNDENLKFSLKSDLNKTVDSANNESPAVKSETPSTITNTDSNVDSNNTTSEPNDNPSANADTSSSDPKPITSSTTTTMSQADALKARFPLDRSLEKRVKYLVQLHYKIQARMAREDQKAKKLKHLETARLERKREKTREWSQHQKRDIRLALLTFGMQRWEDLQERAGLQSKPLPVIQQYCQELLKQCEFMVENYRKAEQERRILVRRKKEQEILKQERSLRKQRRIELEKHAAKLVEEKGSEEELFEAASAPAKKYCHCQLPESGRLMIKCDVESEGCHTWYHDKCVGFRSQTEIPSYWMCPVCAKATNAEYKPGPHEPQVMQEKSAIRDAVKTPLVDTDAAELLSVCKYILKKISKSRYARAFLQPHTTVSLADYYDKVELPMDLLAVKANIENGAYASVQDFADDVRMVWQNCLIYNAPNSFIAICAGLMQVLFEDYYSRVPDEVRELEGGVKKETLDKLKLSPITVDSLFRTKINADSGNGDAVDAEDEGDNAEQTESGTKNKGSSVSATAKEKKKLKEKLPTPPVVADDKLTVNIAEKLYDRVHLMQDIAQMAKLGKDELRSKCKKVTADKMPTWWYPKIHDVAVVLAVNKHGLGSVEDILADTSFENAWQYCKPKKVEKAKTTSSAKKRRVSAAADAEPVKPKAEPEGTDAKTSEAVPMDIDDDASTVSGDPADVAAVKEEVEMNEDAKTDEEDATADVERPALSAEKLEARKQFLQEYLKDKSVLNNRLTHLADHVIRGKKFGKTSSKSKSFKFLDIEEGKPKKRRRKFEGDLNMLDGSRRSVKRPKQVPRDENGKPIFPLPVKGGATVLQLGTIISDRQNFHKSNAIYPVGFKSERQHPSMIDPTKRVRYISEILDGGKEPLFRVTAEDVSEPIESNTPSGVWLTVLKRIEDRKTVKRTKVTVSGPEMMGFGNPTVKSLIEELPGVDQCLKYRHITRK